MAICKCKFTHQERRSWGEDRHAEHPRVNRTDQMATGSVHVDKYTTRVGRHAA